jgi:GNAT superfamily N-acetyltransferase
VKSTVRQLDRAQAAEIVDVLCESFFDYPVMRFILGEPEDYSRQLQSLVHFFVMARVHRHEIMLGAGEPMTGAALVSRPEAKSSSELAYLREQLWADLGEAAQARYEAFGAATAPFVVEAPHIHLNMIGVRRSAQGTGVGRELIEYVHRLSKEDGTSTGVTLTTEDEANLPLYEHFGYRIIGHNVVSTRLQTWGFFRADDTDAE